MSQIINKFNNLLDKTQDQIQKISSPASRAGSVVERAGKMAAQGVDKNVIALQMTLNSPKKQTYTAQEVSTLIKLYEDSKTKVVITAKQARALSKDQEKINVYDAEVVPQT